MKWIVLATLVALPAAAVAQTNTTGTLAPNTTATQTQPSATGGTTLTIGDGGEVPLELLADVLEQWVFHAGNVSRLNPPTSRTREGRSPRP